MQLNKVIIVGSTYTFLHSVSLETRTNMRTSLHLLLGVLGFTALVKEAFGQSLQEDLVNTAQKWKKYCVDKEGNRYKKNQRLAGTCVSYQCIYKRKKYYWVASNRNTCCAVEGLWYPIDNIVYTVEYGPSAALNYTCMPNLAVEPQLDLKGCSVNGMNLPAGEMMMWPEKCASISCYPDSYMSPTLEYHSWYEGTNCCEYDGYLVNNGEFTYDMEGYEVFCNKGKLVFQTKKAVTQY